MRFVMEISQNPKEPELEEGPDSPTRLLSLPLVLPFTIWSSCSPLAMVRRPSPPGRASGGTAAAAAAPAATDTGVEMFKLGTSGAPAWVGVSPPMVMVFCRTGWLSWSIVIGRGFTCSEIVDATDIPRGKEKSAGGGGSCAPCDHESQALGPVRGDLDSLRWRPLLVRLLAFLGLAALAERLPKLGVMELSL